MLWYKGWLETRFRLVFVLAVVALLFIAQSHGGDKVQVRGAIFMAGASVWLICVFLAAAGIVTQQSLQAVKGLHGSTLFTLTLPVSRFRLLAVRAGLGWLEMVGGIGWVCCLLWFLFPTIRGRTTPREMAEYAAVLIVCGSVFYCVTVLLATFLDDLWRVWGSFLCYGAIWWLMYRIPAPASVNIFWAMGDGSPVLARTMPWTAMAFALGLATVLFFAALKVARIREY
jgi:Ca2+/Na+ antiporter